MILLVVSMFSVASFAQNKKDSKKENAPIVGGDSDEHGCKPSAGYQWSSLKNECIRIFESGIRLDPKAAKLNKTLSAFVVFKSDKDDAQAEIFVPASKKSILLKKDKGQTWKNANYILTNKKGVYSLESSKKALLYQSAAK